MAGATMHQEHEAMRTQAMEEIDQYRLCCGGLLEAEIVQGAVILRCLSCGTVWRRLADDTLTPSDATAAPSRTRPSPGHTE